MLEQIIVLSVLLVLSGFFSSAETALFSISPTQAIHIAKTGRKSYVLIKKMKDQPHQLLSTILIGNNVVNVAASALATSVTISMLGTSDTLAAFSNYAVGIVTGGMTFLILVFGEVIPKSIATRNNLLIARFVIFPIYWLSILFAPITWLLNFIPKLTGRIKKTPTATEEELITFVEVVEEEGEIKEEEKELIYNIFEFNDTHASEIITPRTDMLVIDANEPLQLETIVTSGFTRIPVIEGDIDHVIGIVNVKDLFMHQVVSGPELSIKKIMINPYFIPENIKLDKLLHQFKKRKQHLAIVVDEHGGVSGLITLEDLIEEIVGEISDETDKDEPPYIVKLNDAEWLVLGKTEIDEVNETICMNIPDTSEYDTFSGYILDIIGKIPVEDEKITLDGFEVIVKEMDGNRINKYIVCKQ
ncbi:hemolysin family protein [Desulfococcaceae bacterium HSG9]|nr:hemolysin family protein [Desulfococcaceae bacterium HSG9]